MSPLGFIYLDLLLLLYSLFVFCVLGTLSCPLPDILHGSVPPRDDGGYVAGDTAPIQCKTGSAVIPANDVIIRCQHDGEWTTLSGDTNLPICQGREQHYFICNLNCSFLQYLNLYSMLQVVMV